MERLLRGIKTALFVVLIVSIMLSALWVFSVYIEHQTPYPRSLAECPQTDPALLRACREGR